MCDEGHRDKITCNFKFLGVEDGMTIKFNNVGTGIVAAPASDT
jgi:hypothetical protein